MPLRYGNICHVHTHFVAKFLAVEVVATWAILGIFAPPTSADPCPDVEAVFARGTSEPPGVGGIGQAFVDSLRPKIGGKSLGVYPVNYPASTDFPTALDGIRDAGTHVESMATNCPKTRMVLGGYSQGAAVMGLVTSAAIPDNRITGGGSTGIGATATGVSRAAVRSPNDDEFEATRAP